MLACILARHGVSTLLLEGATHPRFTIGESLIPETYWVLKRLNMLDKMKKSHFVVKRSVQFVIDPTWRSYVITYDAGLELCRRFIDGDPARLRRLLTEHVRIGELLSA